MDQQHRPQAFQGNSQPSLGEEPMEWAPEYQTMDWRMVGGVPMASTGSNSTVYSSDSRYSIATAATSTSGYTMDTPPRENGQFSPGYPAAFGNMSLGESSSASTTYFSPPYRSQNERPTPSSIPWDMEVMKVPDFYDFIVEKGKEPYLRLHQRYHDYPSPLMPQIVFLDKDRHDSSKKRYPCLYPGQGCWKSSSRPVFARSADLDRHYNVVHYGSAAMQFPCDYPKCGRHNDPFTRKDHCRDHYKEYHKEDIGEPKGGKSAKDRARWEDKQREWEAERRRDPDWWRCPKCLDRVHIKKNSWTCSGCKRECERTRIYARTQQPTSGGVDDKSLVNSSSQAGSDYRSPYPGYPYCNTCKDTRQVENQLGGFDACSSCASGEYYGEPPYDGGPYEQPGYDQTSSSWYQPQHESF